MWKILLPGKLIGLLLFCLLLLFHIQKNARNGLACLAMGTIFLVVSLCSKTVLDIFIDVQHDQSYGILFCKAFHSVVQ